LFVGERMRIWFKYYKKLLLGSTSIERDIYLGCSENCLQSFF
jgi:hypothetical protein